MARHTDVIDLPWILRFLSLCVYFLVIGRSRADGDQVTLEPFTLKEIYSRAYYQFKSDYKWNSDNEILITSLKQDNITLRNVETGASRQIASFSDYKLPFTVWEARYSADGNFILVGHNILPLFRHSTVGIYAVLHPHAKKFEYINDGNHVLLVMWSPTGSDLIYVHGNDIYHVNYSVSEPSKLRRLTNTGVPRIIHNGRSDWVYEEEVFKSASASWFSPDGRYLAFATINDTMVQEMDYSIYGFPDFFHDAPWAFQYPMEVRIKYPKAGTPNPIVTLSVIDLIDPLSNAVVLEAPVDVIGSDNILYAVTWWNSTHVTAMWTNRVQNESALVMYDTHGIKNIIFNDEERNGWLRPHPLVRFNDYALLLRQADSGTSAGEFQHITRYEYDGGRLSSPVDLTPGPSEVHSIITVDPHRGRVYYLATAPGEPTERNLYWVPLDASQKPACISCEILTPEENNCTYATASFSTEMSNYILTCSGPDPLTITVHAVDHDENDGYGGLIRVLNGNMRLRRAMSRRLMPQQRDFNVTVNGYDARVRLLLPPDFDENGLYPMLVQVYGGPGTVTIKDESAYGYQHYLTTNRRVIYAWIDARGSAFKGSKMLFEIYRRVGTVEVEDTIAVTAALQRRYSWIDANRTGIWGWSYGGFLTGMVLATDKASVFKCGISVAPVTSWIYYDSIYTEQIMGLPTTKDNLDGYVRTDISAQAEGIRGKKYMLIHGTADDNVHYQQAMMLARSLELQDIMFEQVTYTDEAHGLQTVYPHLYHTMDKFWSECFGLEHAR